MLLLYLYNDLIIIHCCPINSKHWAVENKLHWVLDVSFREDESRIRRKNGVEVMSTLRRLTLNLLKVSMERKRKIAIMDDTLRSELVCPVI